MITVSIVDFMFFYMCYTHPHIQILFALEFLKLKSNKIFSILLNNHSFFSFFSVFIVYTMQLNV